MRHRTWFAVTTLIALTFVAACAAGGPPGSSGRPAGSSTGAETTATNPAGAVVTITRTGGIAGVNQRVDITADGAWVYTDAKRNVTERGALTDQQRGDLLHLIGAADFPRQATASPTSSCADAFAYAVTAGGRTVSFADCGSTVQPAVMALVSLVADATPL